MRVKTKEIQPENLFNMPVFSRDHVTQSVNPSARIRTFFGYDNIYLFLPNMKEVNSQSQLFREVSLNSLSVKSKISQLLLSLPWSDSQTVQQVFSDTLQMSSVHINAQDISSSLPAHFFLNIKNKVRSIGLDQHLISESGQMSTQSKEPKESRKHL